MGLLVSPFKGTQSSAQDTPSRVVLQEPTAPPGSANYRMAATPRHNEEKLLPGFIHAKKGTQQKKTPYNACLFICYATSMYTNIRTGPVLHQIGIP